MKKENRLTRKLDTKKGLKEKALDAILKSLAHTSHSEDVVDAPQKEKKVYCGKCLYYVKGESFIDKLCKNKNNRSKTITDSWDKYEAKISYLHSPRDINKDNDCSGYTWNFKPALKWLIPFLSLLSFAIGLWWWIEKCKVVT